MGGREVRKAEKSEMQRGQKGREEEESHVIAFLFSGLQWPSVAFSSLSQGLARHGFGFAGSS